MSTRLRPILMISSSIVAGGNARIALESTAKIMNLSFPPRGSMPEDRRLVEIFDSVLQQGLAGNNWLWLFREPRNTPASRSRYVQLCLHYGIRPHISKKKLSFEYVVDDAIRLRQERMARDTAQRLAEQQRLEAARLQQNAVAMDWYQPLTTSWAPSNSTMQQQAAMLQGMDQALSGSPSFGFSWTPVNPREEP